MTTGENNIGDRITILYVVATPLGNLRDITLRALDVLASVDVIAAEDTRVTAKLLARHGIATRMLLSARAQRAPPRCRDRGRFSASGKSAAAGQRRGNARRERSGRERWYAPVAQAGYVVVPVPGPSAVIAALSASGIAAPQWLFCGFLPAAATARAAALTARLRLSMVRSYSMRLAPDCSDPRCAGRRAGSRSAGSSSRAN